MLQISRKFLICLTSFLILVTCASCKTDASYKIKDYLNYLAVESGIGSSEIIETNFENLLSWGIVEEEDKDRLDDNLDYSFLGRTINNLIESEDKSIDHLIEIGFIGDNVNEKDDVEVDVAKEIVDKAINKINNQTFESTYDYELKENENIFYDEKENKYKVYDVDEDGNQIIRDADFEEVFNSFYISDSYEIDFSQAEVIPYEDEDDYDDEVSYINNKYTLLASNKNHVFNKDGYRISYTLNSSGISVHVSKDVNDMKVFCDLDIKKVKPSFKWTYEEGDLKNCYFNLSMNTTEELGVTTGKYEKYYLKFKDLDSSSFSSMVKSMLIKKSDEKEAIIPICQIKTPIPNVPTATLDFDVLLKFSISGKVELVLYNSHNIGFEVKEGQARFFYDHDDDMDTIAKATARACLGLNVGLDAVSYRLCDIEFDGGLKAELKTTLHLYDSDGYLTSEQLDEPYSALEELSKENPNVLVCGDVSFCWIFDIVINTSKSKLYKLGFTKTIHVLDDDNQVFGNLHHIENGIFVKKCTRKSATSTKNTSLSVNAYNKITLNSYSEVLSQNETFTIEITGLPSGYSESDIRYTSLNPGVAEVNSGVISAIDYGSCQIKVYTSDNAYNTYINILVSTG